MSLAALNRNKFRTVAARILSRMESLEQRTLFSGYTLTTYASFPSTSVSTNAAVPGGQLVMDSSGDLFGLATVGGPNGTGGIFEVTKSGSTPNLVAPFPTGDTSYATAGLMIDPSGNIYGITYDSAETDYTIYELPAGGTSIQPLADLGDTFPGDNVFGGGLLLYAGGNLYGTTRTGGANREGEIFELKQGASIITDLADFTPVNVQGIGNEGPNANLDLVMDSSGDIFGTTNGGEGAGGGRPGTVFELPANSNSITTVYAFNDTDGDYPQNGLAIDSSGNLYGTVLNDVNDTIPAIQNIGYVFKIPAGTTSLQNLATFTAATGYHTTYPITVDSQGDVFGAAEYGGTANTQSPNGGGVVFELPAGGSSIQPLNSFSGTSSGSATLPSGGVLIDGNGNIFGALPGGGANLSGEVYELSTGSTGGGGSLSASLTGSLPTNSLIAGQKAKVSQKLVVTNSSSAPVSRTNLSITYFLSTTPSVNSNSIPVYAGGGHVALKPGKDAVIKFQLKSIPASTQNGSYYVVAELAETGGVNGTIYAASASQITVAPAEIDLTGSFVKGSSVKTGKKAAITITVTNNGNVPAVGSLPVQIDLSTDSADDQNLALPLVMPHINLKPGKSSKVTLHGVVTETVGSYYVFVKLDPNNTFNDVNTANNDFQSPTPALTVTG